MSIASSHRIRVSTPIAYSPAATVADQIAEAIGCIITGRPLPAHLRPAPVELSQPATVSEGITRILAGGR